MSGRVIQGNFARGLANGPRGPMRQPAGAPRAAKPGPPTPVHAAARVVQPLGATDSFEVDPMQLGLAQGGGQRLPAQVLAKMEAALGADFSAVRVHVGPQAGRIGAVAFTVGSDIYFAPGRFQPHTPLGQQLIGHELAHVIQQRQGRVQTPRSGVAVVYDRALEAEADRLGMRAAAEGAAPAMPLQRRPFGAAAAAGGGAIQPSYMPLILGVGALAVGVATALWYGCGHPDPAGPPAPAGAAGGQRAAVVTLTIAGRPYHGRSSGQFGHAEMSALRNFLIGQPDSATALRILRRGNPTVSCPNQDVCGSCSLILQHLGFGVADRQTHFSDEKSGGVSWGASMKVEEFMTQIGAGNLYRQALRRGAK